MGTSLTINKRFYWIFSGKGREIMKRKFGSLKLFCCLHA